MIDQFEAGLVRAREMAKSLGMLTKDVSEALQAQPWLGETKLTSHMTEADEDESGDGSLVGSRVFIKDSPDKGLNGRTGVVVDEKEMKK